MLSSAEVTGSPIHIVALERGFEASKSLTVPRLCESMPALTIRCLRAGETMQRDRRDSANDVLGFSD
jgi:hypothetical protein